MLLRNTSPPRDSRRPGPRSRSNTANVAHAYADRFEEEVPPMPEPEVKPSIRSQTRVPSSSRLEVRMDTRDDYLQPESPLRPGMGRSSTFQGPVSVHREHAPASDYRKQGALQDPGSLRAKLRPASRNNTRASDVFGDPSDDSTLNSISPDRSYSARSVSPATSTGSAGGYAVSNTSQNRSKGPPPPPPSRAKKPPPPPPMKRAEISSGSLNGRY